MLDDHLFHLWYGTIQLAKGKHITVIKLPAHTTDLLQPLDVAVFKSLKYQCGNVLFKRLKLQRTSLTKSGFLTILASEDVWKKSFTGANKIRIWQMWYSPIQSWYALQKRLNNNLLTEQIQDLGRKWETGNTCRGS